jgi:hypothetical protein
MIKRFEKKNKSAMIKRYEKYNLRKIAQVSEKNIKQHDYDILQFIQAGLPIYVLLFSGKNFCCTCQSAFL